MKEKKPVVWTQFINNTPPFPLSFLPREQEAPARDTPTEMDLSDGIISAGMQPGMNRANTASVRVSALPVQGSWGIGVKKKREKKSAEMKTMTMMMKYR